MHSVKRILVVEDSASMRDALVRGLQAEYEVSTADNGLMGWIMARAQPPHLVITDIEMPKLNGIAMVRRLNDLSSGEAIPVIFLTSRDRPEDIVQGIKAGARHYLTKPFHMRDLLAKVHKILPP